MAGAPHKQTAAEEAALNDLLAGGAPTSDEQRSLDGFLSGPQQHALARLAAQVRWTRTQNAQAWQTLQLQAAARAQAQAEASRQALAQLMQPQQTQCQMIGELS
jgi:hypothetical protein